MTTLIRFGRFFVIGTALGLLTIAVREILQVFLPDSRTGYAVSILFAYSVGVTVGFRLQGRFSYSAVGTSLAFRSTRFVAYILTQAVGAIATSLLATTLRFDTTLVEVLGRSADAISFACSALFVSVIVFYLNRHWVFSSCSPSSNLSPPRFLFLSERKVVYLSILAFSVTFTYFAGQDITWDQINYHLYSGLSALNDRFQTDLFSASVQGYTNPYSYVPFYLGVKANFSALTIGILLTFLQAPNLILLYEITRRLFPDKTLLSLTLRVFGLILGALSPIFLLELGSTFNDILASIPVLAAVLVLLNNELSRTKGAIYSGALLGIACGLKFTMLPFVPTFLVSAALANLRKTTILTFYLLIFSGLVIGYVAVNGYWSYRLFREFASPTFPFFNGLFRSPYYLPENIQHLRFIPKTLWEAILLPMQMLLPKNNVYTETVAPDARILLAILFSIPIALKLLFVADSRGAVAFENALQIKPNNNALLLLFFFSSFMMWVLTSANGRYLMPISLLAGPSLVYLVVTLTTNRRSLVYCLCGICAAQLTGIVLAAELRMSPKSWGSRWFELEVPVALAQKPHLFISLSVQPAAFLAAFVHQKSGFVNAIGQNTLRLDSPAGERFRRLLQAHEGTTQLLVKIPRQLTNGQPLPSAWSIISSRLAGFGLELERDRCQSIKLHANLGAATVERLATDVTVEKFGNPLTIFLTCSVHSADLPTAEQKNLIDKAGRLFGIAETQCPKVFSPQNSGSYIDGTDVVRSYINSDISLVYRQGRLRFNSYHLPEIRFSTETDLLAGHPISCPPDSPASVRALARRIAGIDPD